MFLKVDYTGEVAGEVTGSLSLAADALDKMISGPVQQADKSSHASAQQRDAGPQVLPVPSISP